MGNVTQYDRRLYQPRNDYSMVAAWWNLGMATINATSSALLELIRLYESSLVAVTRESERQVLRSADRIVARSEVTGARERAKKIDEAENVVIDYSETTVTEQEPSESFYSTSSAG